MPIQFIGEKDAIKDLKKQHVSYVVLMPKYKKSKYNLCDAPIILSDKKTIDSLTNLLKKSHSQFINHPIMLWETKLKLFTVEKDSLVMVVEQTRNNGTLIDPNGAELRKGELGEFLERVANYKASGE